jgi:hypothetical protein
MASRLNHDLQDIAQQLHHMAKWVDVHAAWIEPIARCPNDDSDPGIRTVRLDATALDDFLNGLRRLGPMLEHIAQAIEDRRRPRLHIIAGGKG